MTTRVDVGSVNPPPRSVQQLTQVTDTREWWAAKGNGRWYLNLAIAGYGSELWGFIESYVIDGYVTQVFIPLDFERQVLRRSATPMNNDRWRWLSEDVAMDYPNRVRMLTSNIAPNSFPKGMSIYLARPQVNGFPCAGILLSLYYQGQHKQILLKDNDGAMYARFANATNNAWSAWRQVSTAAV